MTAAIEATSLVDVHYYDQGLKIVSVGPDKRPAWAPNSDLAGFRDECKLSEGDIIIEFFRVIFQGRRLTWIGCYQKSIDFKLGDRGNHAGLGVWVCDSVILHTRELIESLVKLSAAIKETGLTAELKAQCEIFGSKFLPTYSISTNKLPQGFVGVPFCSTEPIPTLAYESDLQPGSGSPAIEVAAAITHASIAPNPSFTTSRVIIRCKAHSEEQLDKGPPNSRLFSTYDSMLAVIEGAQSAFSGQEEMLSTNRTSLAAISGDFDVQRDLAESRLAQIHTLTAQTGDLKSKLESTESELEKVRSVSEPPSPDRALLEKLIRETQTTRSELARWQSIARHGAMSVKSQEHRNPGASLLLIFAAILLVCITIGVGWSIIENRSVHSRIGSIEEQNRQLQKTFSDAVHQKGSSREGGP